VAVAYFASDEDDFVTINIEDSKLDARAGNDTVSVNKTGALVFGSFGNDFLSANIHLTAYAETYLATDLRGGVGNDTIDVALSIENYDFGYDTGISANLEGGRGDDVISLDLRSSDAPLTATVHGGSGDDTIAVTFGLLDGGMGTLSEDLSVWGGAGDDTISVNLFLSNSSYPELFSPISGGAGDDTITAFVQASGNDGGDATSRVLGGAGDDTISSTVEGVPTGIGGSERNVVRGGSGDDHIEVTARGTNDFDLVSNNARGGGGDDVLIALGEVVGYESMATNTLAGGAGDDHLTATLKLESGYETTVRNFLSGDAGDDVLRATIKVSPGSDEITARSVLSGGEGDDRLTVVGGDHNRLFGNQGDDTLIGGKGDDRLIGGQGADFLKGNGGDDTFVFMSARGEGLSERDRIADFHIGQDVIDLSHIDANAFESGNQSFDFSAGSGSGHVWVADDTDGAGSLVYADTGRAVLVVAILDGPGIHAGDYSASDFIL
jgi:Ca2+-binding RTX toxin-like protein